MAKQQTERESLEFYLDLDYPVVVKKDPDGGYTAEIEELSGCMTQGETIDEVYGMIDDARKLWVETAYDEEQTIPLPADMQKYTGRFILRIPRSLHANLAKMAKQERVSLNQYVALLLAAGVSQGGLDPLTRAMLNTENKQPLPK